MVWNGMSNKTASNGNRASFDTGGTNTTSRNGNHASGGLRDFVGRYAQEADEFACFAAAWYRPNVRRPPCSGWAESSTAVHQRKLVTALLAACRRSVERLRCEDASGWAPRAVTILGSCARP